MAAFSSLSSRLAETFTHLRSKGRLSPSDVDATVRDIRRALLDADVALPVVKEFTARVRERALADDVNQALNPAQQVVQIVNDELVAILGGETRRLRFAKNPPTVILLVGLQGAGKTTLAGKLGLWLRDQGHTPLLVAADLQRPNAVDQLKTVGEQAGVPVFAPEPGNGTGDPVHVARDALSYATAHVHDVVVVDTAGRLGVDERLMKQVADIRRVVDPDEVLFVLDAMTGQDAVATAEAFLHGADFTGVVLSKLDGDTRGGAALSVASVARRPILFASTGEKLDEFEVFHPDRMAGRILDMGDVLTLIEQAQKVFDAQQAQTMARKMADETFDLEDFLAQMQQLKNMGSMKKMLAMLPGAGQLRGQIENFDEREITRAEAIIQSMTPAERHAPRLLNGSRRARIAAGSGTTVTDVNSLVKRFEQAAKMMKTVARGGMPQIPGMGSLGMGGGRGKQTRQAKRVKGKSGNPAKRAAEEKALRERLAGGRTVGQDAQAPSAGSAFGVGGAPGAGGLDPEALKSLEGLGGIFRR